MLEGFPLVLLLAAAVAFIIVATAKLDLHAFLALLIAAYLTGLAAGLDPAEVASLVTDGFGGILGYIGIVIVAGTIIGTCLERSGAAIVIAETVLDYVGEEYTTQVMAITGSIVSIPVFCDSGFVILSGLNRSLAERSGLSLSTLGVALAGGLYVTHVFVPPTPGPIAAAGIIGADIGLVMLAGLIVSAPIVFVAATWADRVASNYHIDPNPEMTIEEIKSEYGSMPSRAASFAPLLVPIVLIALGSIAAYPEAENPELITGTLQRWLLFLGDPAVALIIGAFIAFAIVPDFTSDVTDEWVSDGIKNAAVILAVTGAGGAFGEVLSALPLENFITDTLGGLGIGLLAAFVVAAAMKSALGSSTVAILTTAGLVAPLLGSLGLDTEIGKVFTVLAIGAGSMTVSHANDSYFWIITEFTDMETSTAYQAWTLATLVLGLSSIVWIVVLRNVAGLAF
ncbi:gluconate transporter [Natrinema pellirubrum DSM 15624]|uniref:Gluconate transporter n=1 Tax=Natrinema pellirubrum (strain DSM 15624 / CIP 106293 / JCM 10476 / NCIMB 786 / 157) TaxID=797303 RepID=L0JQ89_NATP1|nr:GntP family permease [Natrinema pellirubrum]AGB32998.1 H+/gluconate symporter family protein [Natrinema pellirubrum DSM 15624]ELY75102.1 gluconate transporter [Natrinema pellirubrum DSM 15624]